MGQHLSERERQVITFMGQGRPNKWIARELRTEDGRPLSPHTITQYARRIFAKLEVHSRTEAVAKWMAIQHAAELERINEHNATERLMV